MVNEKQLVVRDILQRANKLKEWWSNIVEETEIRMRVYGMHGHFSSESLRQMKRMGVGVWR